MKTQNPYFLIGDELLIAVFNEWPKQKVLYYKGDYMLPFYKASKKPEYAELFQNYKFDEDGASPYSKEIADGFFIMETCHLKCSFPETSNWYFSKGVEIGFNKYINPRLNEEQRQLIKKLSAEIQQDLLKQKTAH